MEHDKQWCKIYIIYSKRVHVEKEMSYITVRIASCNEKTNVMSIIQWADATG